MSYIEAICISTKKGVPKDPVPEAEFITDWGINGDAHAGHWHRQVSLLAGESIDEMKKIYPPITAGDFGENIITRGIDLKSLTIGDILRIGDNVILKVTQIGKECHSGCAIKAQTGDCIMPREGIFVRIIQGATVRPKDIIKKMTSPNINNPAHQAFIK